MRKFLVPLVLAVAGAMAVSTAAEAGRIGSPSVSRASVSRPAFTAPARIGGGQSVGMRRTEVMQAVRTPPAPKPVPPAWSSPPRPAATQTAGQVAQAPRSGPGWGTVVGAAAAGALAGHLLTDSHPSVMAPAMIPATSPVGGAPGYAAPGAYIGAAPSVSGGGFGWLAGFLGTLVLFAALALLAWFAYRVIQSAAAQRTNSKRPTAGPLGVWTDTMTGIHQHTPVAWPEPFGFSATSRFLVIQEAFARGDEAKLRELLGPDMEPEIARAAAQESKGPSTVGNISHEVVDDSGTVVSIHYQATDHSDGSAINEVWHFISVDSGWRLNGIEPV